MTSFSEKLTLLRNYLQERSIDTFIIPSTDPHFHENVPDHWRIIYWLTGFTGSSATLVITPSFAGLWTDSRYYTQAERQLHGSGFQIVKPDLSVNNSYIDFVSGNSKPGDKIGIDGRICSLSEFRKLERKLKDKNLIIETECDPFAEIWSDRPSLPQSLAFDHKLEFSGKDRKVKISEVRKMLENQSADFLLITSPEDTMWLLNIRGSDLKYSPLLYCFALLGKDQVLLFIDENKIPVRIASEFDRCGVVILPYEDALGIVSSVTKGSSVLINPKTLSVSFYRLLSGNSAIIEGQSIPGRIKSIKNHTEINNISKVMIKDGAALTRFFFWLTCCHGKMTLSEKLLGERLNEFRLRDKEYICPSFSPIAAFNENSAQPHYDHGTGQGAIIGDRGILLVDSGGHYLGGTTDITRTIPLGIPTLRQKKDFTLVLKGHINLAMAKFPLGTRGYQLDILARRYLWDSGLNYGHGTGHGVGYCLNVHEGPQSISPSPNETIIESGMLISNEPALYREGEYGIRIENLLLCYEDEDTEFGKFLKFDTVSLCYIEKALIDKSLLDQREIDWVNSYHSEVYSKLSSELTEEERKWLKEKTDPI